MTVELEDLTGKLLIAMPGMGDDRFAQAVIFLCAHSDEGAMGLVINKRARDVRFADLLEQLSIEPGAETRDIPIHFGGPVEHGRGFVLHSPDYTSDVSTLEVDERFSLTGTLDVLENIAHGRGPEKSLMGLGYAGWGPLQLESELAQNGWLTCEASHDLVFETPDAGKWAAALKTLGVDPSMLSAQSGWA